MVRRTDGMPFPTQAQVSSSLCVSCGICVGSCPSSTPFRRTEELRTGIDLPDFRLKELRERTINVASGLNGPARILVLACEHGCAGSRQSGVVKLPCAAMAPPSLIDYVLSKKLADGVVVAGCAESYGYNRLGVQWTEERFSARRDPYLRARVPRERVKTIWASSLETARFETELAAFAEQVSHLPAPPERLRSPESSAKESLPTKSASAEEVTTA